MPSVLLLVRAPYVLLATSAGAVITGTNKKDENRLQPEGAAKGDQPYTDEDKDKPLDCRNHQS